VKNGLILYLALVDRIIASLAASRNFYYGAAEKGDAEAPAIWIDQKRVLRVLLDLPVFRMDCPDISRRNWNWRSAFIVHSSLIRIISVSDAFFIQQTIHLKATY